MVMAATQSAALAIAMIPIYLAYHFIENYLIGPTNLWWRLRLSNLAVLVAFAIGAELGGVVGALLADRDSGDVSDDREVVAARQLGDDVVAETRSRFRRRASYGVFLKLPFGERLRTRA